MQHSFNNSRKIPKLAQFIPGIYNIFYYKIIEYFGALQLLDGARREASEAVNSAERLTEEYHGLRGDLHQQINLVAQRDEVIGRLRTKPVLSGLLGGDEVEESLSTDYSGETDIPTEAHFPSSPFAPSFDV